MITTGENWDGYQSTSEIIDLTVKGGNQCKIWADFPRNLEGATGGFIGDTILICGGRHDDGQSKSYSDECYKMNGQTATLVTSMSTKRSFAASIVLNGTTLWITGGWSEDNGKRLASSEFIKINSTVPGPELPIGINRHAMVAINSTSSLIVGGSLDVEVQLSSTYFYNQIAREWIDGPNLMQARRNHAAGIVTDEETKEKLVIVTGGYFIGVILDSTELLFNDEWNPGKWSFQVINTKLVRLFIFDLGTIHKLHRQDFHIF